MFTRFSPKESPERRSSARVGWRRPAAAIALAALAAFASFALAGCAQEAESANLVGTFKSTSGDYFTLAYAGDGTYTFTYRGNDYSSGTPVMTTLYAGTVAGSPDLYAAEGVLVFKVTEAVPDTAYGPNPTPGKYYAVRWQNLSITGVCEAGPYKPWFTDENENYMYDAGEPMDQATYDALHGMDTAEEAAATFTVANGFFPADLKNFQYARQ